MMKKVSVIATTLFALSSGFAFAHEHVGSHQRSGHNDMHSEGKGAAMAQLPQVDAEVRRVDASANKLALRHGHIPNLDMPPMSMSFSVKDPALLDGLKPGDKLMVTIDEIDGTYTVLSVERVQP